MPTSPKSPNSPDSRIRETRETRESAKTRQTHQTHRSVKLAKPPKFAKLPKIANPIKSLFDEDVSPTLLFPNLLPRGDAACGLVSSTPGSAFVGVRAAAISKYPLGADAQQKNDTEWNRGTHWWITGIWLLYFGKWWIGALNFRFPFLFLLGKSAKVRIRPQISIFADNKSSFIPGYYLLQHLLGSTSVKCGTEQTPILPKVYLARRRRSAMASREVRGVRSPPVLPPP